MKKATITVDTRMINSSGIGVYLKNVLPQISKKFELTLLGNKSELELFNWTENCKIITFDTAIYSIEEQLKFPRLVPNSDLFWCPHFNVPMFPVKAKKIVSTIHDLNHLADRKNHSFIKRNYAATLYKNAVRKSDKIITVSNFSKSELLKYTNVNENKIEVIHCGVSNAFFEKGTNEELKNIPEKYILFVGNVKPHKNVITLLKAYNKLPKSITSTHKLVILGKKEGFITSDEQVFKFINNNNLSDDIVFTGHISDNEVPNIYKKAKLFIFPSLYEGFGLPILEAMASKVPVLSSNAASLTEVGGDAILYFNPMDFEDLSNKIQSILLNNNQPIEGLEKSYNRAKSFSWDKTVIQHVKTFQEVIKI